MTKDLSRIIEGLQIQIDALYELADSEVPDKMIHTCAAMFCQMDDDQQAKFFNEVAAIMSRWQGGKLGNQAYYIGRHLAKCECATPDAREFIEGVHWAMKQPV